METFNHGSNSSVAQGKKLKQNFWEEVKTLKNEIDAGR
jgi:hypothetical protein